MFPGFRRHAPLDGVSWQIARGEQVCIIGRNGAGKSSMLRLVKGDRCPMTAIVWRAPASEDRRVAAGVDADERTVFGMVAEGLAGSASCWRAYHHLSQNIQGEDDLNQLMHAAGAGARRMAGACSSWSTAP